MLKKIVLFVSFLFIILSAISFSLPVQAQTATSIIDPNATGTAGNKPYEEGNYSLDDILIIVISASRWILGIVGSLALLMFIYGGFTFLTSAGSSEKIGQAQKIIVAAVIGLIIVFASYLIIKFVLQSLGLKWNGGAITMLSDSSASHILLTLK